MPHSIKNSIRLSGANSEWVNYLILVIHQVLMLINWLMAMIMIMSQERQIIREF